MEPWHKNKPDVIDRWVDTYEKAVTLLKIRNIPPDNHHWVVPRMMALFEIYPETMTEDFTHQDIADLIGTTREQVTRYLNKHFGVYRNSKNRRVV